MTKKKMLAKIVFSVLVFIFVFTFICPPAKAGDKISRFRKKWTITYTNTDLHENKVAYLFTKDRGITIHQISFINTLLSYKVMEKKARGKAARRLAILPGFHTLYVGYKSGYKLGRGIYGSDSTIFLRFKAEPDHVYEIRSNYSEKNDPPTWSPVVIDITEQMKNKTKDKSSEKVVSTTEGNIYVNADEESGTLKGVVDSAGNIIVKFPVPRTRIRSRFGFPPSGRFSLRLSDNVEYIASQIRTRLLEDGRLEIEDDISAYFPDKIHKGTEFTARVGDDGFRLLLYNGSIIRVKDDIVIVEKGKGLFYQRSTKENGEYLSTAPVDKNSNLIINTNTYYKDGNGNNIPKNGLFDIENNKIVVKQRDVLLSGKYPNK